MEDEMDTGSYNDADDYSYSEDSQGGHQLSTDRLPLVPTDFTSVQEALQNFTAVFESRYGLNPRFQLNSLREALAESFDNKYKSSAMEQKPFALYLHRDDGIAGNIFAQNVLCSEAVLSLLNAQFVLWAWDMTVNENRGKFFEWLIENSLVQVKDVIKSVGKDDYPLLILLTKDRGTVNVEEIIRGTDTAESVMEKMINCLDSFQQVKNRIATEEQNRLEREAIRQEQVNEYELSKAIDKARQEEVQRQKQREIDEQEEQVRQQEAKEKRLAELASMIPDEPSESDPQIITIRLRLPSGEQKIRRFRLAEKVNWLSSYVESLGFDMDAHCLWTSDVPRRSVTAEDMTKTFEQMGWPRREQIIVDEK